MYLDHPAVCSDDNASKVGKIPLDEHFLGSGTPQKPRTQKTSQTPSHPSQIRLQPITPGNWVLCWGSRSLFGSLTTRNPTRGIQKPKTDTSASKYFKTSMISLLAADSRNKECASAILLEDFFSKGWICLTKYPSCISVTMDPESSNDGTSQPNKSIGDSRTLRDCPFN